MYNCHYCFFNLGFEFQISVCNCCHDLMMMCLNLTDIAITNVKWVHIFALFIRSANLKQFIC